MEKRNFNELLQARMEKGFHVCVGLDADYKNKKFPKHLLEEYADPLLAIQEFCSSIVGSTFQQAGAYKPNYAFYLRFGDKGLTLLNTIVKFINSEAPEVPVILDAKFADIGNTNIGYVEFAFDILGVDAVTLNPYLGKSALQPFLDYKDKGLFILVRTSNEDADLFQNLNILSIDKLELYKYVAKDIYEHWNENHNCGMVFGATATTELAQGTKITAGSMPILIPGVGEQGGELEATVKAATYNGKMNAIINVSRSAIFKSSGPDYADAAAEEVKRLNNEIHLIQEKL